MPQHDKREANQNEKKGINPLPTATREAIHKLVFDAIAKRNIQESRMFLITI